MKPSLRTMSSETDVETRQVRPGIYVVTGQDEVSVSFFESNDSKHDRDQLASSNSVDVPAGESAGQNFGW